jgi:DNA repair exonuclease SbcCD ATPase subunit
MLLKLEHIGKIDCATFDIKQGVTTVLGANGVGKSTLVNALYLALTGETIDGCNLDEKVNWDWDTGSVTLVTDTWKVTRTIGKKSSCLLEDKAGTRLTKKTEVNDYIFKYYNIESSDILKEVYFAAQYRAVDILETTPAKRLDMLASVFGLAKYDKAQRRLYQELNNIPVIMINEELLNSYLESEKTLKQNINQHQEELEGVVQVLSGIRSVEEVTAVINSATEDQLVELDTQITELSDTVERDSELFDKYAVEVFAYKELKSKLDEKAKYEELSKELEILEKERAEIDKSMPTASADISDLIQQTLTEKASLEASLKEIQKRKDLLKDGLCPLSGTPPCSGLLAMADPSALDQEEQEINNNLLIIGENLVSLRTMESESKEAYKRLCDNDSKQTVLKVRLSQFNKDCVSFQLDPDKEYLFEPGYIDNLTQNVIPPLNITLTRGRQTIAELKAQRANIKVVSKEEKAQAEEEYKLYFELAPKKVQLETLIESNKKELASVINTIEMINQDKEKLADVEFKRSVLSTARQVMTRDYLPRLLLERVINQLNTHLLYYINLFNFPYNCSVKADGDFSYLNEQGQWVSMRLLSGGQKYIVALMLRLAFASTIRTSFPFYVLDEPTTGLDYQNRCMLADLFKDMEAKLKPLYLVIPTHDVEVAEVATNKIVIGE